MSKRKLNTNRQQGWEIDFFFLNAEIKPQCLICNTVISSNRSFNISRHYSISHEKDYRYYNGDSRVQILKSLKMQQHMPKKC